MHSHDLDQIAALADGSLAPHLQDDASALVASCDECRDEFDAQTSILSMLADIEPAELTDIERARLHQTIAKLDPVPSAQRNWMAWLPRLAVAAAAVAFVGTFGVLFFGGGTDTAATDGVAAEAPVAEDAAAADESVGEAALSQMAPATESAAAEAAGDVELLTEEARYAEIGDLPDDLIEITEGFLWRYLINAEQLTDDYRSEFECLATVEERGPIQLAATARQNGDHLEIYLADGEVVVLDPEDCSESATP